MGFFGLGEFSDFRLLDIKSVDSLGIMVREVEWFGIMCLVLYMVCLKSLCGFEWRCLGGSWIYRFVVGGVVWVGDVDLVVICS